MQRNQNISRTEEQIGRLLMEGGFITQENLDEAIEAVRQEGLTLRNSLVTKGYIADETYSTFLSMQTRVPLVDLRQVTVSEAAVRLVPEDIARHYNVLPLMIEGDSLRVAMDDPQDVDAINTLTTVTGHRISSPAADPGDGGEPARAVLQVHSPYGPAAGVHLGGTWIPYRASPATARRRAGGTCHSGGNEGGVLVIDVARHASPHGNGAYRASGHDGHEENGHSELNEARSRTVPTDAGQVLPERFQHVQLPYHG